LSQAGDRMEVVFARETGAACPVRSDGTTSSTTGRVLHVRPQGAHEALQKRRQEQLTPEFRKLYATRAGVEGTLSQAVRGMGLRRARYDGLARTHMQHILTAVAINVVRIDAVLTHRSRGKIRQSHFAQLASTPALPEPSEPEALSIPSAIRQQSLESPRLRNEIHSNAKRLWTYLERCAMCCLGTMSKKLSTT
jgi:Transposase DDE domain